MSGFTLEELHRIGWYIVEGVGISTKRASSIRMELHVEGRFVGGVSGLGPTKDAAMIDAISEANRWIQRQDRETLIRYIPTIRWPIATLDAEV